VGPRGGRGGEEKNPQPLPGLEPPITQPVAQRYSTELSRLLKKTCVFVNFDVLETSFRLKPLTKSRAYHKEVNFSVIYI
jgi:hypothetical protein